MGISVPKVVEHYCKFSYLPLYKLLNLIHSKLQICMATHNKNTFINFHFYSIARSLYCVSLPLFLSPSLHSSLSLSLSPSLSHSFFFSLSLSLSLSPTLFYSRTLSLLLYLKCFYIFLISLGICH